MVITLVWTFSPEFFSILIDDVGTCDRNSPFLLIWVNLQLKRKLTSCYRQAMESLKTKSSNRFSHDWFAFSLAPVPVMSHLFSSLPINRIKELYLAFDSRLKKNCEDLIYTNCDYFYDSYIGLFISWTDFLWVSAFFPA